MGPPAWKTPTPLTALAPGSPTAMTRAFKGGDVVVWASAAPQSRPMAHRELVRRTSTVQPPTASISSPEDRSSVCSWGSYGRITHLGYKVRLLWSRSCVLFNDSSAQHLGM